jgi:hypothetical protein
MSIFSFLLLLVGILILALIGALVVALIARTSSREGPGDSPNSRIDRLKAREFSEREVGIRAAAELGTPEARRSLLDHLAGIDASEGEGELLLVFQSLLSGWGVEHMVAHWTDLPDRARMDFLVLAEGSSQFTRESLLALSRRGMEDEQQAVSRRAWRTYGYTVTSAFERDGEQFDFAEWLSQTEADPNSDIQGLRRSLQQKRMAETQNHSLESLTARYRVEVFKVARGTSIMLNAEDGHELTLADGTVLRLPAGAYPGMIGGSFDNAHDAVQEGWKFELDLEDVEGSSVRIESTWSTDSFFGEILDARHDQHRCWFDEAPEELVRAFSVQPFAGPVVAYGDTWDMYEPRIDGEAVVPEKCQVLSALIAVVPHEGGPGSQLALLLYEFEDAANDGDEVRPFVTTIDLSHWVLEEGEDAIDCLTARIL